jgi:hypothetical protein
VTRGSYLLPALLALPSAGIAQDFHESMQPVADYSRCVSERARTVESNGTSVEESIDDGMAKCKGPRSGALSATRARMIALGLPANTVKQSAETMFASMEASMKESLTQELAKARDAKQSGVRNGG